MNPEKVVLFKPHPKRSTLTEQIETTVTRHINNYYVGVQDLSTIPASLRPQFTIQSTDQLKSYISSNEILRNKKLSWLWRQDTPWAQEFKDKVNSETITTLTEAKQEAVIYYKKYSDSYQGDRATKVRGGSSKRTRILSESESDYRTRLAARKILCPANIMTFREQVEGILDLEVEALDAHFDAQRDAIENLFPGQMSNIDIISKQAAIIALLASKLC